MSRRLLGALMLTSAVAVAGCGGARVVAWDGTPRVGAIEGGRTLFGTVVNRAGTPLWGRAAQVRVVDHNGRVLPAAALFAGGYNSSIALRGFGGQTFGASTAGAATGARAAVAPGSSAPL